MICKEFDTLYSVPTYQGICHLCREEKLAQQYSRKVSQQRRQTIVDQDAIKAALGNIEQTCITGLVLSFELFDILGKT